MSNQYPGGLITKTPVVPNSISAPGIWTLTQQAKAQATNTWPFPRDPQFNYVTMLLHGDGSAGPVAATGVGAGVSTTVTNFNADASTNNFNVTINGDARSDNFTPYQAGYYSNFFDGSGDYLTFPSNATFAFGTGDFTVEFWVNETSWSPTGGSNYAHWISINSYTTGVMIRPNLTGTAVEVWVGNTQYTFTTTLALGTWYHIAVSRSSSSMRFFVNGTQIGSTQTVSYNISTNTSNTIGTAVHSTTEVMQGYLSNLRIVSGSAVYTSNFTPSTTPLTAITNTSLLTCQSNRFIDNSSNAFTITVNGNTAVAPAQPFTLPTTVATYGSGYFDGTGDYLNLNGQATFAFGSSASFTIQFWFYASAISADVVFYDGRPTTTQGLYPTIYLNNSTRVVSYVTNSTEVITGSTTIVVGQWYFVTLSRNSGSTRLFVNGVQQGSTYSDTITYANPASRPTIMQSGYASNGYLTGYVTDFQVINGTGYSSVTVPTSPLTAITNTSLLTTQYNGGGNNSGFKDSSQNNFVITRNGNTTQGTFAPYGADWSNYFDGDGDGLTSAVSAGFAFGTGDFTYEAWYYSLDTGSSLRGMFDTRVNSSSTGGVLLREDSSGFLVYVNGTTLFSVSGRVANTWQHIALVRQGSTIRLYINGVQATSASSSQNFTDTNCRISGFIDTQASPYGYFGYISNARVVKGTCLYPSGTTFTPSITPLTAISGTSLLTCQGNRFFDASSNALTITVNGSPSVQGFSPFAPLTVYNPATYGGSAYFDGTGDYLTAPNNASFDMANGDFTVELWFNPTQAKNTTLFTKRASNASYSPIMVQWTSGSQLVAYCSTSGSSWGMASTTSATYPLNSWIHVAFVRYSNNLYLYVNGVSAVTAVAITSAVMTNTSAFVVGADDAAGNLGYAGYISNCRVVKGTAVYTAAFTPPTAPLTAITNTSLLVSTTNAAILDNAMMNNLETVGNAQISTSVVKYGTASMYFDGSGDGLNGVISPLFDFGSGSFTVEFWANCVSTSGTGFFVSCWDNSGGSDANSSWLIRLDSGNVITHFMQGSGTYNTLTSTALSTNTWFHFAWVKNGTTQTMYINGTSVASGTVTGSMNTVIRSLKVGYQGAATNYLNGYIDDLRITKGYARYTTTFTPPTQAFPNG
jgi:hypothetical protein